MKEIYEFSDLLTVKKITQTNEMAAKGLETIGKTSDVIIEPTKIRVRVPSTPYTVVYEVKKNPRKVLVVKKIVKHK